MKKIIVGSKQEFDSIFEPIAFFLLGIIIFLNPKGIITITLYAFGAIAFVYGLFKILLYYKKPEDKKDIITGLVYMLIGLVIAIFTYFMFDAVQTILRYSLAALFLYTGIIRIAKSFKLGKDLKMIYIVTSAILLFLALILALIDFAITTTGLFLAIYAIIEAVGYILVSKEKIESKIIPEANILKEKEEEVKQITE